MPRILLRECQLFEGSNQHDNYNIIFLGSVKSPKQQQALVTFERCHYPCCLWSDSSPPLASICASSWTRFKSTSQSLGCSWKTSNSFLHGLAVTCPSRKSLGWTKPLECRKFNLFAATQKICTHNPEMDTSAKVLPSLVQDIPFPFKCKGTPNNIAVGYFPYPVIIRFRGNQYLASPSRCWWSVWLWRKLCSKTQSSKQQKCCQ